MIASDQPKQRQPTRGNILQYLSNLRGVVPEDGLLLVSFAKPAMQGFIEALRLNLKAFLTTGLELDELCPNVVYGDSCADRLVLLSAHKDGILRIDDSHCKLRWKPGPEWAKLEGLLP